MIELLIVIAILALLVALLSAGLVQTRQSARSTTCQSNLRQLMIAIHAYAADNDDCVLPSYTMRGTSGGALNPLEGWGPILHSGRYAPGNDQLSRNPYVCPNTLDRAGVAHAQTGTDPQNPLGYMDWPAIITLSSIYAQTIPQRGYNEIIRVGYWMNADNPISVPRRFTPGLHFSGSVGYGPDPQGRVLDFNRFSRFKEPTRLIALADGLYAGNQEVPRHRQRDSRVGYRHPGRTIPRCNLALADGHCESMAGDRFPRRFVSGLGMDLEEIRIENLTAGPTTYTDPGTQIPAP